MRAKHCLIKPAATGRYVATICVTARYVNARSKL